MNRGLKSNTDYDFSNEKIYNYDGLAFPKKTLLRMVDFGMFKINHRLDQSSDSLKFYGTFLTFVD